MQQSSNSRFDAIVAAPAVVTLVAMMLNVTANALLRTFAENPITGTLALSQYWYIPLIALIGFVTAQSSGRHVAAELIFDRFPPVIRRWVAAGGNLLCALLAVAFVYYSTQHALESMELRLADGVSGVVIWPITFLVPVAFLLLGIQFGLQCLRSVRNKQEMDQPPSDQGDTLA